MVSSLDTNKVPLFHFSYFAKLFSWRCYYKRLNLFFIALQFYRKNLDDVLKKLLELIG